MCYLPHPLIRSQVQQRVLLLVGENDLVIPSATEGPRLQRALPRALLRTLPGRSHAMLQVSVLSVLPDVVVVVDLGFV
jgi:pimeloyl-ACP methyl ester carboxylesterase